MNMDVSKLQLQVITGATFVAFLLMIVVTVSPGWAVQKVISESTNETGVLSYGILYSTYCTDTKGQCRSMARPESFGAPDTPWGKGMRLVFASSILYMFIPVILLGTSLVAMLYSVKTSVWSDSRTTFCLVVHSVTVALLLTILISQAVYASSKSLAMEDDRRIYTVNWPGIGYLIATKVKFPWCLFLCGFPALITAITALYFTIVLLSGSNKSQTYTQRHELQTIPQSYVPAPPVQSRHKSLRSQ